MKLESGDLKKNTGFKAVYYPYKIFPAFHLMDDSGAVLRKEQQFLEAELRRYGYVLDGKAYVDRMHRHPKLRKFGRTCLIERLRPKRRIKNAPLQQIEFVRDARSRLSKIAAKALPMHGNIPSVLEKPYLDAIRRAVDSDDYFSDILRCSHDAMLQAIEYVKEAAANATGKSADFMSLTKITDEIARRNVNPDGTIPTLRTWLHKENCTFGLKYRQTAEQITNGNDPGLYKSFVHKQRTNGVYVPVSEVDDLYRRLLEQVNNDCGVASEPFRYNINKTSLAKLVSALSNGTVSAGHVRNVIDRKKRKPEKVGTDFRDAFLKILDPKNSKLRKKIRTTVLKEAGVSRTKFRALIDGLKEKYTDFRLDPFCVVFNELLYENFGISYCPNTLRRYASKSEGYRGFTRAQLIMLAEGITKYMNGTDANAGWDAIEAHLRDFKLGVPEQVPDLPNILDADKYDLEIGEKDYLAAVVNNAKACVYGRERQRVDRNFLALMDAITSKREDHPDTDVEYTVTTFHLAACNAAVCNGYKTTGAYLRAAHNFFENYPFVKNGFTVQESRAFLDRLGKEIQVA